MKTLINDSIRYPDGSCGKIWIEYPDSLPPEAGTSDPDILGVELQIKPIAITGYRLTEEKILPSGEIETVQEFFMSPDSACALFEHWKESQES